MTRGIIVTNGTPTEGIVYHMALVFDNNYHSVREFRLMPVQQRIKSKTRPGRKPGSVETVTTEDTLIYGDILEWLPHDSRGRDVEFVRDYRKVHDMYPTRLWNGESHILLQGIMSKNRRVLWMCNLWPDLEIPYRLQQMSHPNVTVNAWVVLHMRENQTLKYELHSFKETADSFQHLVRTARWNEGQLGNLPILYDPVAGDSAQSRDFKSTLSDTVTGMHGIVISKKIVLVSTHPDYCFHRVVIRDDDNYPKNGTTIRFNAEKIDFLNIYALQEFVVMNDTNPMPLSANEWIRVTIRFEADLHGFYFCKTLNCYVDDPDNVLEAWLVSPLKSSVLQVGITATEPSIKGTPRFVVAEVTEKKKLEKIEKFKADGGMELKDEPGIVIDYFGRIHVMRLPKSNFRVPADQRRAFPPGTRVFFSAVNEDDCWKVTAIRVNQREPTVTAVVKRNNRTQTEVIWFHIEETCGCLELPFLISAPLFGLVATPLNFRIPKTPHCYRYHDVWITLNDCHPGEIIKPQAKFKFAAVADRATVEADALRVCEKVVVVSNVPDYPSSLSGVDDDGDEESFDGADADNNLDVPAVYPAIPEEEFERAFKNYGLNVKEMIRELERNPQWRTNPNQLIDRQIEDHLRECPACKDKAFDEGCYFAEYLSQVLQRKPEVTQVLKSDMASMLALRRFRQ